jgi:hypothetical protein
VVDLQWVDGLWEMDGWSLGMDGWSLGIGWMVSWKWMDGLWEMDGLQNLYGWALMEGLCEVVYL